jgi:hypothetical protein
MREMTASLPNTEDKSFEGVSILMTMLGLTGAIGMSGFLFTLLKLPSRALQQGTIVLLLLATVMLVIRSVLHARAGVHGMRETDQRSTVEMINQYANFAVIAAFVFGAVLFMLFIQSSGRGMPFLPVLTMVAALTWMLLLWPMAVRKYVSERQFTDLMNSDSKHTRAVDGGLTVLGWFLLGHAMLSASMMLPSLFGQAGRGFGMLTGGTVSGTSQFFGLVVVGLEIAAARELIMMGSLRRLLGIVYGVAGAGIALYNMSDLWKVFSSDRNLMRMLEGGSTIMFAMVAVALVIPAVTVVAVTRSLAPTATARFVSKP